MTCYPCRHGGHEVNDVWSEEPKTPKMSELGSECDQCGAFGVVAGWTTLKSVEEKYRVALSGGLHGSKARARATKLKELCSALRTKALMPCMEAQCGRTLCNECMNWHYPCFFTDEEVVSCPCCSENVKVQFGPGGVRVTKEDEGNDAEQGDEEGDAKDIFALGAGASDYPIMDSGAAITGCNETYGGSDVTTVPGGRGSAVSAMGEKKVCCGTRTVSGTVKTGGGGNARLSCKYKVVPGLRRPVMSVAEANDRHQTVWFSPLGAGVASSNNVQIKVTGEWLPLPRKNGVFEVRVDPKEEDTIAAVEAVDDEDGGFELKDPVGAEPPKQRALQTPEEVSDLVRQQHCDAGHVPQRTWCNHCFESMVKEDTHLRADESHKQTETPEIQMDYTHSGSDDTPDEEMTVLDCWDRKSGNVLAVYCRAMGPADGYQTEAVVNWLKELSWPSVVLKPDGQAALVSVTEAVKQKRLQPTRVIEPPEGDHQAIGGAEGTHSRVFGTLRAIKKDLEARLKIKIGPKHPLMPWLTRHAAWCRNKFQKGHDGKTAHERLVGRPYGNPTLTFGE